MTSWPTNWVNWVTTGSTTFIDRWQLFTLWMCRQLDVELSWVVSCRYRHFANSTQRVELCRYKHPLRGPVCWQDITFGYLIYCLVLVLNYAQPSVHNKIMHRIDKPIFDLCTLHNIHLDWPDARGDKSTCMPCWSMLSWQLWLTRLSTGQAYSVSHSTS